MTKHRLYRSLEYKIWISMKQRCSNPNDKAYANYGGRGIKVCERWSNSFEAFCADLGPRPTTKHTLERRDNSKGYDPENCYWATRYEQSRNSRRNRFYTLNGETKCLKDWIRDSRVAERTVYLRLSQGLTFEQAIQQNDRRFKQYPANES